ncbi:MAG: endolytic transglycosylase MltG [Chitinophagaceae bacterium]|nr:endolytic transglycosylase MltG [Chitinophagaceae bacterium]
MKKKKNKKKWWIPVLLVIAVVGALIAWLFVGSATSFSEKSVFFTVTDNNRNKSTLIAALDEAHILRFPALIGIAGAPINLWDKIKNGKYEIKKGQSIVDIVRMLKNGKRAEVKLVINKLRTKQDLAGLLAKTFERDSAEIYQYLSSNDSLASVGTDTALLFTKIIPNTYRFYADASIETVLQKLSTAATDFWETKNRKEKAASKNLSLNDIYILASIVEEETNYASDKSKIASVYLNRLVKKMPLQACPTIKYAMQDFSITRIYEKYLVNPSPYNTYNHKGLPPGPICTPSPTTIDLVLDAPSTDYLYFVAKSDFSGYHHFSSTYEEHNKFAKEYQQKLDEYMLRKAQQKK